MMNTSCSPGDFAALLVVPIDPDCGETQLQRNVSQTCSFGYAGLTPQGLKSKRVIAERGQKVIGTKRANSRENVTVVATINAAGEVMPPLIIFKGQRFQEEWIANGAGVPGAMYAVTDSSMMQGPVFLNFIKRFHQYLVANGKIDGKPHVIILDGHTSHISVEVIRFAMDNNLDILQLPSHSSHVTQPLDVCAFGIFKRQITEVLHGWARTHGNKLPVKGDMNEVIRLSWSESFKRAHIVASFEGSGLWPVDADRAINRLKARGTKRKEREGARPPLRDVPVASSENELAAAVGDRGLRELRDNGHTLTGLRVNTVLFGEYIKVQKSVTRSATGRIAKGVVQGGILTTDEIVTELEEERRKKQEEEAAKAARKTAREARRLQAIRDRGERPSASERGGSRGRGERGRGGRRRSIGGRGGRGEVSRALTSSCLSQNSDCDDSGSISSQPPLPPAAIPQSQAESSSPATGDTVECRVITQSHAESSSPATRDTVEYLVISQPQAESSPRATGDTAECRAIPQPQAESSSPAAGGARMPNAALDTTSPDVFVGLRGLSGARNRAR